MPFTLHSITSLILSAGLTTASPFTVPDAIDDTSLTTQLPHLQPRQPTCDPTPNQDIEWADCVSAFVAMPRPILGKNYHFPPGIDHEALDKMIVDTPFRPRVTVDDEHSPYRLPRNWTSGSCRVTLALEPGVEQVPVLFWALKYRVSMIFNLCVGGGTLYAPGPVHPGMGGHDSYKGVRIDVGRA